MSDTRDLSHDDLEDTVTNLRKQSKDNDQASVSDESDYYESDDTDRVLAVDDHIFPVAEPYWCDDYEFSKSHDGELCDEDALRLSTVSWAIIADRGEIKLSSLIFSIVFVVFCFSCLEDYHLASTVGPCLHLLAFCTQGVLD